MMSIEPDEYYDMAGRLHYTTVRGGVVFETIELPPTERLPDMTPDDELVLPNCERFDETRLVLRFRAIPGRAMSARIGLVEAVVRLRPDGRYEAMIIKGQRRISTRTAVPNGYAHQIPAMLWCERVLVEMR